MWVLRTPWYSESRQQQASVHGEHVWRGYTPAPGSSSCSRPASSRSITPHRCVAHSRAECGRPLGRPAYECCRWPGLAAGHDAAGKSSCGLRLPACSWPHRLCWHRPSHMLELDQVPPAGARMVGCRALHAGCAAGSKLSAPFVLELDAGSLPACAQRMKACMQGSAAISDCRQGLCMRCISGACLSVPCSSGSVRMSSA